MDYESALNETRTNAEQSETGGDLRVSFESEPSNPRDKRLMYYEHQLQRHEDYSGYLDETNMSIEEMRALYEELTDYFGITGYWNFPLPCKGLPGLLHNKYSRDDRAAEILLLGIGYVDAIIRNERKSMHNRWREAKEIIWKIEKMAEEEVEERMLARATEQALIEDERKAARPSFVYFIGYADSGPIKIGIATNVQNRLKGLQTSHHEKLFVLAACDGDGELEKAYHDRFRSCRLNGEWFERTPELLAEIERLNADA